MLQRQKKLSNFVFLNCISGAFLLCGSSTALKPEIYDHFVKLRNARIHHTRTHSEYTQSTRRA